MRIFITIFLLLSIAFTYYLIEGNLENNQSIKVNESLVQLTENNIEDNNIEQLNSFDAINQRPLFNQSREYIAVVEKKIQKSPVTRTLKIQALGIAKIGNDVFAVVRDLTNGKIKRLRVNEEIHDWVLEDVSEQFFTFSKNQQKKRVDFKK